MTLLEQKIKKIEKELWAMLAQPSFIPAIFDKKLAELKKLNKLNSYVRDDEQLV